MHINIKKTEESAQILSVIQSSKFPVGAIYLSEKLDIPQASIGRILAELDNMGFLEKISNKGRQITEQGQEWLSTLNARKLKQTSTNKLISIVEELSKERLLEILAIRKKLEGFAVELACQYANEEEITELESILVDHRYAVQHGKTGSEEDLRLHLKIAKISRNSTLYQMIKLLLTGKHAYDMFSNVADHFMIPHLQQHANLVVAIKEGNPDKAQIVLKEHLNQVISDIKEFYTE